MFVDHATGELTDRPAKLRCTCRVAIRRGSVVRPVRQRRWDCPSCGRDQRERFVLMSLVAQPVRMVTLTVRDAVIPDGSWSRDDAGRVRAEWTPDWHGGGSAYGHTYVHRDGSARFAPQTWCPNCLRHIARQWQRWVQRARVLLPGLEYQWATEQTSGRAESGSVPRFHRHVLLAGIPRWLDANVRDKLAADWAELAGNLDLGRPAGKHADYATHRKLAFYLAKYLTKAQTRMASGFRRWGRSRGFAPVIPMRVPHVMPAWGDGPSDAVFLGPYDVWAERHGIAEHDPPDRPRPEPSNDVFARSRRESQEREAQAARELQKAMDALTNAEVAFTVME